MSRKLRSLTGRPMGRREHGCNLSFFSRPARQAAVLAVACVCAACGSLQLAPCSMQRGILWITIKTAPHSHFQTPSAPGTPATAIETGLIAG